MKIIEAEEVRRILTPARGIAVMKQALKDLEEGRCVMPQRLLCTMPNTAVLGFMPAYAGDFYGAKIIAAYAPNMGTVYPSHIGYVMLFESAHSTVAALVEAGSITEIRTGCVSAVATDLLARRDAHTMGLIGAGAQARSHLAAIRLVRPIDRVTVFDIRPEAALRFAQEASARYGLTVEIASSAADAVKDADIVCTLTPAKMPYLTREMVRPGTHINAVGTFTPTTREVASDLVAAARLYADHIQACRAESGEYLIPLKEKLINENHILGSLGQLLTGKAAGRASDDEITLFDALGLAVESISLICDRLWPYISAGCGSTFPSFSASTC